MKVVVRVDSSKTIGTGHVVRCLTFARTLQQRGANVSFVCRRYGGHIGNKIIEEGFQVSFLSPFPNSQIANFAGQDIDNHDKDRLGVRQVVDANETISMLPDSKVDLLIVDHYELDEHWEGILREYTRKLLVVDDLVDRQHKADLIVNPNYFGPDYSLLGKKIMVSSGKVLVGPRYAFLRSEYRLCRKSLLAEPYQVKRVLVYLGGSILDDTLKIILEVLLLPEFSHLFIDVVLGQNTQNKNHVMEWSSKRPKTSVYSQREHLADLMERADIAIGGGGSTTWERMCIGVPSIIVALARNQVRNAEALANENLVLYAGRIEKFSFSKLRKILMNNIKNPDYLQRQAWAGQMLVDGLGAERVREAILPSLVEDLKLRPANQSDCFVYFSWANDPVVRAAALDTRPVAPKIHLEWFSHKLSDEDSFLFIMESNGLSVGQIRFDCHSGEALIDYSLDELVRGRGWAEKLVILGVEHLSKVRQITLKAFVRPCNTASIRVFRKLGFHTILSTDEVCSNQIFVFNKHLSKLKGNGEAAN